MKGYNRQKRLKSQLKKKLMSLLIGICILLSIIFTVASWVYTKTAEQKVIVHTENNLSQTSNYIALLIDQAREIAQYISKDSKIVRFANLKDPSVFEKYMALREIGGDITLLSELNSNLDSIYVYFQNAGILFTSLYGDYLIEMLKDSTVFKTIQSSDAFVGRVEYINDTRICKKGIVSFMVKGSTYNADIRSNVYLMINFDEKAIFNIIKDIKSTNSSMPFLLTPGGKILSCENKSLLGTQFLIKDNETLKRLEGHERMTVWDQKVYAFVNNHYSNIFRMVYLAPEDDLLIERRIIITFMSVVFILYLFTGILINTIYMKGVYHPLMKLVDFMEKAEEGNLGNKIKDHRKDEFGYLYTAFNTMITRIDNLIKTTHQQDELRRKMEIKELQKQIDPHFLYNTLDTINWIANKNNVPEISTIVLSLSNIYQNAFNKGSPIVSCRDAVKSCRSYLDIQNIRFYDKLSYIIETDSDLDDCLILNLLLQTLVENAIVHGFENMDEKGAIVIRNEYLAEEDAILFTVADDGKGMGEGKLALQKKLLEQEDVVPNSGLTNVQRRIKLYYGSQYGITIESRLHEGTTVYMKIPRVIGDIPEDENLEEV